MNHDFPQVEQSTRLRSVVARQIEPKTCWPMRSTITRLIQLNTNDYRCNNRASKKGVYLEWNGWLYEFREEPDRSIPAKCWSAAKMLEAFNEGLSLPDIAEYS